MRFTPVVLLAITAQVVTALTAAQWRSQSIYQVVTDRFARTDGSTTACSNLNDYCGGTWQGLINKLDYIQNMGFTAIWISPVVKNVEGLTTDGSSYHGYWAQDIYQVNSHFGTSAGLKALSAALHGRGMYLMVDIVPNHFAHIGAPSSVDYGALSPFNNAKYFHPYCAVDYSNQTSSEVCWLGSTTVPLVDVKTEDSTVRSMYNTWISQLVSNYTIDGLRLDTASEIEKSFYPGFASAAGVHILGEVFNGDPAYTCPYQQYLPGVLNYPAYYWITQAFQSTSGSMLNLYNGINSLKSTCADTTVLGSFLENHDNPRFVSLTKDESLIKNALAFTMLQDGIPIVYYGQEQKFSGSGTPSNRETLWSSSYSTSSTFYGFITTINKFRTAVTKASSTWVTYKASAVYQDGATIAIRKGDTGSQSIGVFSNKGTSGNSYTLSLTSAQTGYTASLPLTEVLTCSSYTTDASGNLAVSMAGGLPRIFYPTSKLSSSGLCATSGCPAPVTVTFSTTITTAYGETIKLVGSVAQLGSWDATKAVALDATAYTSSNPVWSGIVSGLTPGATITYKFIRVDGSGVVTWEADPDHSYTVPTCAATGSVSNTWQS